MSLTKAIDIIGIGALNIDHVASLERLRDLRPSTASEILSRFDAGREQVVSEDFISDTRSRLGDAIFSVNLGGSAFNVVQALRSATSDINLGYIGSAGSDALPIDGFHTWFATHGVNDHYVHYATDAASGACLSLIESGERSLLTTQGANRLAAEHLRRCEPEVIEYVARSRCVHLTSFFDPEAPKIVLKILQQAKEKNPGLVLSFDPGLVWCQQHSTNPEVLELLKLTNFLFVNTDEFRAIGGPILGNDEQDVAGRILAKCNPRTTMILQKNYSRILVFFRPYQNDVVCREFAQTLVPPREIQDATGAGDVFAAGFLLGLLVPGFQLGDSIELALRMVRKKLQAHGQGRFKGFSELVGEVAKGIHKKSKGNEVFIGHGRDPVWRMVQSHLRDRLQIKVRSWEAEPRFGDIALNVLSEELDRAAFGVFVLTGEDETAEGASRARQNVVHEIGLFQGRHGFNKVILIKEGNIEPPSNLAGWQMVTLRRDNLAETLRDLEDALRKANFLEA